MKVCNIRARTVTVCGACSCSSTISNLARSTSEPIYITKNGEGDGVFMNIDAFEKREQALELRAKIMQAEEERLNGAKTRSISEARKELRERAGTI